MATAPLVHIPTPVCAIKRGDYVVASTEDFTGTYRVYHIRDQIDDDSVVLYLDVPHWSADDMGCEATITVDAGATIDRVLTMEEAVAEQAAAGAVLDATLAEIAMQAVA